MITVNGKDINQNYTEEEAHDAVIALNDIINDFNNNEYVEGTRNNMAVDLSCACHVLNLDPVDTVINSLEKPLSLHDLTDLRRRVAKIDPYLDDWDQSHGGVFSKMLMTHKNVGGWVCVIF